MRVTINKTHDGYISAIASQPGITGKVKDLTGRTFERLTVIRFSHLQPVPGFKNKHVAYWVAKCICGREATVRGGNLTSGSTKSCGCLQKETVPKFVKHLMSLTPTYKCWQNMKNRCLNPNVKNYSRYGGRGIDVCDRWLVFENFLSDMGEKPANMSLERIDNSKGYSPENCKWASIKEQALNKGTNPSKKDKTSRFLGVRFSKRSKKSGV